MNSKKHNYAQKSLPRQRKMICLFLSGLFLLLTLTSCGKSIPASKVTGVDTLPGSRIGVQLATTGDLYASDMEEDEAGTQVERYTKGSDAISALKQGKVDCVIIDEQPAKAFIANNSDLSILDQEFTIEDYAIVIAKENDQLCTAVNDALAILRSNGTLANILSNYLSDKSSEEKLKDMYQQRVTSGDELIMATNATFPPYEYYSDGTLVGIDVELARAIADQLGMVLTIDDMEFDTIINSVSSGKADLGLAGFTVTEDRKTQINFSDPYTTSKQVIVVRNGSSSNTLVSLKNRFYNNFIKDGRWKYLAQGLFNTLIITIGALIIGLVLGFLIALIRVSHDRNNHLKPLNLLARIYVTMIRGTPVMVQLLIIYFVIFSEVNISKIFVAIIAFGLNSAAYISEIIRSGIMSIDPGQFEAGKSLGLSFRLMMIDIILPQAMKNVLPAIGNEFISLLKETSIAGYIGLLDLTRGGDIIRGITYDPFLPLLAVALVYLALVALLTFGVKKLENHLKKNER